MSGQVWKYSDVLDEEDGIMLGKYFITYQQGADYYGLGIRPFTRLSHEAGAVYKIGKMVRIRRELFEEYLRKVRLKKEKSGEK